MSERTFTIRACWDEEAGVYYSQSDLKGLAVEAKTLEEFEEIVRHVAPDLIEANYADGSFSNSKLIFERDT